MTDLQLSYLRSAAKIIGGILVAKGVLADADIVTLTSSVEALVGAAMAIYGVYRSHKAHA